VSAKEAADSVVSNPADFPFFTATIKGFYFDAGAWRAWYACVM
jgi:hypothetical protein